MISPLPISWFVFCSNIVLESIVSRTKHINKVIDRFLCDCENILHCNPPVDY